MIAIGAPRTQSQDRSLHRSGYSEVDISAVLWKYQNGEAAAQWRLLSCHCGEPNIHFRVRRSVHPLEESH